MTGSRGSGTSVLAFDAEALLEKAAKLGCEQAEVYEAGISETPVNYENNKLKSIETAETAGAAVRVIKDGKLGFATSSRAGDSSIVDMAVRAAEFGPEAELSFTPASSVRGDLAVYDRNVADWPQEKMLALGEELVDHIRAFEDGVLASVTVEKRVGYKRVATSRGQDVYGEATGAVIFAGGELVEPENMIHFWRFSATRNLAIDVEKLKAALSLTFRNARRNVPFAGGKYPVVFTPMAAMDLINPMAACVDGMAVVKGESPWRDKIGETIFDQRVTLVDDPALPWGVKTTPFDDEGTPTSKRPIIDKGVLRGFLLDHRAGKALGRGSTGNGFRASTQGMPRPAGSNLVLEPGPSAVADLVSGIKEGLYIERLMGAWAGNAYAGQVSGNVHVGFRIADGEIAGRVKDCMVSVNVFEAFKASLAALSRETEVTNNGMVLPHVVLDGVSVSTKGS